MEDPDHTWGVGAIFIGKVSWLGDPRAKEERAGSSDASSEGFEVLCIPEC